MTKEKQGMSEKKRRQQAGALVADLSAKLAGGFVPEAEMPLFDFNRSAYDVAADLEGAVVRVGDTNVRIISAKGFEDADIRTKGVFKIAQDMTPGTITGVPYRGIALSPNITASDRGLVLPTAVEVLHDNGAELLLKMTQIARAFGLEPKSSAQLTMTDAAEKRFRLTPLEPTSN